MRLPKMTKDNFGLAYDRGYALTVRFLCSRGVPIDEARECSQAAWVKGWERLGQLQQEDRICFWVNSIALNVYRGILRRGSVEATAMPRMTQTQMDLSVVDLSTILNACSVRDRQVLQQRMVGMTDAEIASGEGVSTTSVRLRFLRAKIKAKHFAQGKPRASLQRLVAKA